jgi:DNA-binding CsgD family transcriptional regulator
MVIWNKAARARKGDPLTRRDLDIHASLAAGDPTRVIADRFGVAPVTVKAHLISVYTKIGAQTAVGAARHYLDHHHAAPPPGGGWWPDKPRQRRADHSRPASTRP